MRADEAIARFSLFSPGDRVLCALSGGADSVCLTHFLAQNASRLGLEVAAAHFSHGLRPEAARAERELCRELCRALSVPLFCGEGDTPALVRETGMGEEEAARTLRRAFLLEKAREWGAGPIATGHHLEDSAETLLFHLIRGAGGAGRQGIPPKAGRWVRPLILTSRGEIEAYLAQRGLDYADDSTNRTGDNLRAVLRREVFPVLRRINGQAEAHLARSALELWQDSQTFRQQAEALPLQAEGGGMSLSVPALLSLPEEGAARALQRLQREAGGRMLERSHIAALLALCRKEGPGRVSLPGSRGVRQGDRLLILTLPPGPPPEAVKLFPGEQAAFGRWRLSLLSGGPGLPVPEAVCREGLTVRSRQPGDRLTFSYGSKPLKKWLIEKKIPREERDALPVVWGGGRILAVGGLWKAQLLTEKNSPVLYLDCRRNEI